MRPCLVVASAALLTACLAACSDDDTSPGSAGRTTSASSAAPSSGSSVSPDSSVSPSAPAAGGTTEEVLCAGLTPEALAEVSGVVFSDVTGATGERDTPYCDAVSDDMTLLVHADLQPPAASFEEVRDALDPLDLPRTEVTVAGRDGLLTAGRTQGQTAANVFVEVDGRVLFAYAKSAVGLGDPPSVDVLRTLVLDVAERAVAALDGA